MLVVGAGPAGAAAAIEGRRLGLDVLVVDKARFPRDKTCGDGLTAGALRGLEALGLDVRKLPSYASVTETVLVSPSGREVLLPLPDDGEYAGVVPRAELDAALVERARDEGVTVREGVGVTHVAANADAVDVELDDGTSVCAQWAIAADGHYSPVRRMLDVAGSRASTSDLGTWHAFRQYFRGVDDGRMWVLFDPELLPGYAWVFPVGGGRANVGFGVLRDTRTGVRTGKQLAAQWRQVVNGSKLREILGPRAEADGAHRALAHPRVVRSRAARAWSRAVRW